jgi:signal transduction histidine kinase
MGERAEMLGGRLMVESAAGKGARVVLRLPLTESVEPEPDARAAAPASRAEGEV